MTHGRAGASSWTHRHRRGRTRDRRIGSRRGDDGGDGASTGVRTAHAAPRARVRSIVVVMFENRSFDNVLGGTCTRPPRSPPRISTDPAGFVREHKPDGKPIAPFIYQGATDHIMQQPQPDPGETYPHVNTQLFGIIDPPTNAQFLQHPMSAPFNNPQPEQIPTNSGFVHDYIVNYRLAKRQEPTPEEYRVAMGGFSPEMLPVLSTLAREFAVYDNWFAAVPSQTFCNRSFFHASTSHGYVTNHNGDDYEKWINAPAAPTIFNRLEEAGIPWRVYYDLTQLVSMTGMLHASVLRRY
jgi:phospholipase C